MKPQGVWTDRGWDAVTPSEPLVDGFLDESSTMLVFGPPGAGKSTVMTGLACSVASGDQWAGMDTRPGVVAYLATERALVIPSKRQAWESLAEHRVPQGRMGLYFAQGLGISSPVDWQGLSEEISVGVCRPLGLPFRLMIIDVVHTCFMGASAAGDLSENVPMDWHRLFARITELRRLHDKLSVILVGHPAKGDVKTMRGSGASMALADCAYRAESRARGAKGCELVQVKGSGTELVSFDLVKVRTSETHQDVVAVAAERSSTGRRPVKVAE